MSSDSGAGRARGELFILSGPSGSGKTTLIRRLLDTGEVGCVAFSVSHTTRAPRQGERQAQDYHFVSKSAFEEMVVEDRFLEWARVHDHLYGTSVDEVLPRLEEGVDVLLDIDVQGARKILDRSPGRVRRQAIHGVFVLPPSYADLRQRLLQRRLDDPAAIRRRLETALQEIRSFGSYEYVIINDNAGRASRVLASIILEKRHRQERMQDRVAVVLDDFRSHA